MQTSRKKEERKKEKKSYEKKEKAMIDSLENEVKMFEKWAKDNNIDLLPMLERISSIIPNNLSAEYKIIPNALLDEIARYEMRLFKNE